VYQAYLRKAAHQDFAHLHSDEEDVLADPAEQKMPPYYQKRRQSYIGVCGSSPFISLPNTFLYVGMF